MPTKNDFAPEIWRAGKEEIKGILKEVAGREELISYSRLAATLQAIDFEARDDAFAEMLGEVSSEEFTAGRGMLSVLVVHEYGDKMPGPGFFELAQLLGYDASDHLQFWSDETNKVYQHWKKIVS